MSAAPIVSVIIPCFNQGRYLADALRTVRAQTLQDTDIIVVDDGSSDPDSLAALASLEDRIDTLIRTDNRGVISARNTAIEAARGRYILPLDADDTIEPSYLERAVAELEKNPTLGIVYCKADFFGARTGPWELPPYRFPEILVGNMIFNSSVFRRADWEKVGGYNPNMQYGWEDYDFWLSIIALGREVLQLPETLFHYRILANSRNSALDDKGPNMVRAHVQIYRNHRELYDRHIDTVFAALVRLWGQASHAQENASTAQREIDTLRAEIAALQARCQTLEQDGRAHSPGLVRRIRRLFGA